RRFSAMSSLAMTLIRDTITGASARGGSSTSRSTPSTRRRIDRRFSKGSIWISEAFSLTASDSRALIRRMMGASSWDSSRSSGSASPAEGTMVLLAALLTGDWARVQEADPRHAREGHSLVTAYLSWHLERGLKSLPHLVR